MSSFYTIIVITSLFCIIPESEIHHDTVENRRFQLTPPVFRAPLTVAPLTLQQVLWQQRTGLPGLLRSLVRAIMCSLTSVSRQTDMHTDKRTKLAKL